MAESSAEKIERTVRQTSSLIWRVEAGAAFFTSAAAAVFLLLAGIGLDHLWPGGMPRQARLYYAFGAGAFFLTVAFRRFFPLFRYRINPLYSAERLEQAHPDLKNGLVNWLLLRSAAGTLFGRPFTARTAASIPPNAVSDAVDMRPLVRSAFWFIASITLLAVYLVAAERSCFVSAARILLPTAQIGPPQRIRFRSVEPGTAGVRRGEHVTIRARFDDVPPGEVQLVYSTADGRLIGACLAMNEEDPFAYVCQFPESDRGLEEDILYHAEVMKGGSHYARSGEFRLTVLPPMKFVPETITCRYPAYTRLEPLTVETDGDISVWEGTEVTLTARSNYPLSQAFFIPDFSRREAMKMTVSPDDPYLAEVRFALETDRYTSYQLLAIDTEKNASIDEPDRKENDAPCWRITVRPDPLPIAAWDPVPAGVALSVAEHGVCPLAFTASDEFFGLSRAELELVWSFPARPAEKKTVTVDLSNQIPFGGACEPLTFTLDFSPAASGIPAGASVECRGVLYDNRPGEPGRGETPPLSVLVTRDEDAAPQNDSGRSGQDADGAEGEQSGGDGQNENQNRSGEEGQQQDRGTDGGDRSGENGGNDQNSSSGSGENRSDPQDPSSDGQEDHSEGTGESVGETTRGSENGGAAGSGHFDSEDAGVANAENRTDGSAVGEREKKSENIPSGAGTAAEGGEGDQPGENRIDPDSDPAGAFDAILDFSGLEVESATSDAVPQGRGTGVSSPETEKHTADLPPEERRQIKSAPGTPPENAPRQTDSGTGEIPADAPRQTGNVSPETSSFMATEGTASQGVQVPADAQIQSDPNSAGVPADESSGGTETASRQNGGGTGTPVNDGDGQPSPSGGTAGEQGTNGENPAAQPVGVPGEDIGNGTSLSGGTGSEAVREKSREAAAADKANLEYTEKATNLVLSYLDDELKKKTPDPRLLDRLGWTAEELRAFREKWSEMREKAGTGPAGRRQYEEELRDMGLRPKGVWISGRGLDRKSADGARAAEHIIPPADFEERLREYNNALNRGGGTP